MLGEWPVRQRGHSLYAEEKRVFRIIDKVGVDHIVFETDLLHPTSLFDEDRLVGALANLGYTMSDQTVGNILRRHGIPPAPDRKKTTTWKECIRTHREVLVATDFFTTEVWTKGGLVTFYVLFFLYLASHKVHVVGVTSSPHQAWMTQITRNVTMAE